MNPYTTDFYRSLEAGALSSAQEIFPLVLDWVQPQSVIDVGCGTGAWLSVARAGGVQDIVGLDGAYVDRNLLQIPDEFFQAVDLLQPPRFTRTFDLVLSLEVAEHLPSGQASLFVRYLTSLGPVVLFSAAAPHQGGDQHVNEQWPAYWAKLFAARGFVAVDALRRRFWRNEKVEYWYAQNTLLYVQSEHPALARLQAQADDDRDGAPLALVHPRLYQHKQHVAMSLQSALDPRSRSLKEVLCWLPMLIGKALARKFSRMRNSAVSPKDLLAREL